MSEWNNPRLKIRRFFKSSMRRRRDIFRAGFPAPTRPSTYSRRDARHAGRSDRAWLLDTGDGAGNHFIKPAPARDKCSIRQVNMTISLAFLAPELVKAAIEGRLPRGTKAGRARIAHPKRRPVAPG
jgi:site-specific DNA recombinase